MKLVLLILALAVTAPVLAGEPFDWDRYHARQDACLEKDRIVADCVRGIEFCDELVLRQAQRACSPFGSSRGRTATPARFELGLSGGAMQIIPGLVFTG
jgi:hypothetical protein